MVYKFSVLVLVFIFSLKSDYSSGDGEVNILNTDSNVLAANAKNNLVSQCKFFYASLDANHFSLPKFDAFFAAFQGFEQLKLQGKIENEILTVIDFSLSSTQERLWIIDMKAQKVLMQTLVAHGRNSGFEFAKHFSNENESYKSSLGFYITGESYQGKHGTSLRLDGMEQGINDKARDRAIVIHGAAYVNKKWAKTQGYIGRSLGCPAVPMELHKEIIETIKNQSCVFIYHPSRSFELKSKLIS